MKIFKKLILPFFVLLLLGSLFFSAKNALAVQQNCQQDPSLTMRSHTDGATHVVYHLRVVNNCNNPQDIRLSVTQLPTQPRQINGWLYKFNNANNNTAVTFNNLSGGRNFDLRVNRPSGNVPAGTYTPVRVRANIVGNANAERVLNLSYVVENSPTPTQGAGACKQTPTLDAPDKDKTKQAGQTANYTLTLKNNNPNSCTGKRDYKLEVVEKPTNWIVELNPVSVNDVSSQAMRANITASVKSRANSQPGNYKVRIRAVDKANSQLRSVVELTYVVQGANPTPSVSPTATPTQPPPTGACRREEPQLLVDPAARTAPKGSTVTYNVTVRNRDQGGCAPRNLSLARVLPNDNWTGSFNPGSLTINPNSNATSVFSLTSPSGANGTRTIKINLRNQNNQVIKSRDITYTVGAGPTVTPTPTATPTPSVSPGPTHPANFTHIQMQIGLDGIGRTSRIPIGGNDNPNHRERNMELEIFLAEDNTHWATRNVSFLYNDTFDQFSAHIGIPMNDADSGKIFNIYVKSPQSLKAQYPGSYTLVKGQNRQLPTLDLVTGDINHEENSENRLDILDYNTLIDCSIFTRNTGICDSNPDYRNFSDLNDDGLVDQDDYTLWLREAANQSGDVTPS
jgi:hypothetical protein